MIKLILILLVGLLFESTGVVLLKKGMSNIDEAAAVSAAGILKLVKAGATNPQILLGVFFEALFFGCLLYLMSKSDISFLWPLTGLSFVFATLAAVMFLGEKVSAVRWLGVVLIMLGAGLITYSQQSRDSLGSTAAAPAKQPQP